MTDNDDSYNWWREALMKGVQAVDMNTPQCGFYASKNGDGSLTPAAIWRDHAGALLCRIGSRTITDETDIMERWPFLAKRPRSYEDYQVAIDTGQWPDAAPAVRGHNAPPDELAAITDEIDDLIARAEKIKKDGVTDQKAADLTANLGDRLKKLRAKAEKSRKEEKQPHLDAGRAVDAKWTPAITSADAGLEVLRTALSVWLRAEKERKRREAEAAAKQAIDEGKSALDAVEKAATDTKVAAGTTGRAMSLRTFVSAEITDYDKVLAHFAGHEKVVALVQGLANAAIKSGAKVPGAKRIEEERAV